MDLFSREYGSGPSVIILHGLFGMSDNWVGMARRLSHRYHVYLPDLRNHGRSPHSPVHSYPSMAGDLEEFIHHHNIRQPVLIGHSMGGKLAMLYASEHPDVLKQLAVLDISPRAYNLRHQHHAILEAMLTTDIAGASSRSSITDTISDLIPEPGIRDFVLKNLYRPTKNTLAWRLNVKALDENLDLISGATYLSSSFKKPSLFIRGERSDYIIDDDIPLIQSYFPAAEVYILPRASHWMHAEEPEALYHKLMAFLDGFDGW